ncbi:hypothetical protein [Pseudomonas umsongensis]
MPSTPWLLRAIALVSIVPVLSSCASFGPPTGWVAKNPATNTGTFMYGDGGRYEGGYSGEKFQGRGTIFYEYSRAHQGYYSSSDAPQLRNGQLSGEFSNGSLLSPSTITYTTEWNNNATYTPPGAFTYTGGYDGGFKGKGKVVFKDGRVFKGEFGNEQTLYSIASGERVIFKESPLIGSYFEGPGKMRWSNGATFEGVVFRYYLFDRDSGMTNPDNFTCVSSLFFGKGLLKEPGKPDYFGVVGENYEHLAPVRSNEERFINYAERQAECPSTLAMARDRINGIQSEMDAEMAEGRANAQAMLAADLSNLASKVSHDAARIDAVSRGSTYEIEQEKRQRNSEYAQFITDQEADPTSDRAKRLAQAAPVQTQTAPKLTASSHVPQKTLSTPPNQNLADTQDDAASRDSNSAASKAAAERLEHEKSVKHTMDEIERKRIVAADVAKKKAERENEERQFLQSRKLYLAQINDRTKLSARTCPGGEGKHYVVGLKPTIKPEVVECLDVSYTANCPGTQQTARGVIKNFLGASTDCFMGDTAEIAPQLTCKANEVVVAVREVTECK